MTANRILDPGASAAGWRLRRRAPTWLLIVIVGGALLGGLAHGQTAPLTGPAYVIDGDIYPTVDDGRRSCSS